MPGTNQYDQIYDGKTCRALFKQTSLREVDAGGSPINQLIDNGVILIWFRPSPVLPDVPLTIISVFSLRLFRFHAFLKAPSRWQEAERGLSRHLERHSLSLCSRCHIVGRGDGSGGSFRGHRGDVIGRTSFRLLFSIRTGSPASASC